MHSAMLAVSTGLGRSIRPGLLLCGCMHDRGWIQSRQDLAQFAVTRSDKCGADECSVAVVYAFNNACKWQ